MKEKSSFVVHLNCKKLCQMKVEDYKNNGRKGYNT